MTKITVIFHDDPANPVEGLRDAVKSVAESHGGQLTEVDPNKVTITASGSAATAIWMDLQALAPIQISHDGSAEEHSTLLKATQELAAPPKPKKKKDAA